MSGELIAAQIPAVYAALKKELRQAEVSSINISGLTDLDSAGVALLDEMQEMLVQSGRLVLIEGASELQQSIIETFSSSGLAIQEQPRMPGFFETIGQSLLDTLNSFWVVLILASELAYWSVVGIFDHTSARKGSLSVAAYQLGAAAFPIVALLSFIIGFILSLQSGLQLKTFGANVFLPDLLSITMVREMASLVTAIIVAGRSGSSIASEVATMKVTEELDALKAMALNPLRYTIVPKIHGITIVMPILVFFSILFAMIGGAIIGIGMLELSPVVFLTRSLRILVFKDILITYIKSTVFAWVIVVVGSHYGFQVKGGAEGVGKATTMAVVTSIFTVIVIDAIFSLLYI
ncbi:MAG TPA: ABC transporter permease [Candidatus Cloacimonadota bacterium]|nr:ABC transporter permease [Candidatus Cloacimonadota bacterium]